MNASGAAERLDYVTVSFLGDAAMQCLQARAMALYLDPATAGHILVVNNDPDQDAFASLFRERILPAYGPLRDHVRLLAPQELLQEGETARSGWRRQQGLKIEAVRRFSGGVCLVLDGKNHLIRPWQASDLRGRDGRLAAHPRRMKAAFQRAFDLFDIPPEVVPPIIANIMTPFAMVGEKVRAMDDVVRYRTGHGAAALVMGGGALEFTLYWAFLVAQGEAARLYNLSAPSISITVWGQPTDNPDLIDRVAARPTTRWLGVHRRVATGDPALRERVARLWCHYGLVTSEAEGLELLAGAELAGTA